MPYKNQDDQRAAQKRHYQANKQDYIARARANQKRTRSRILVAVLDHLKENPCIDCGESDPIVLEFDHRDSAKKDFAIAESLDGNSFSLARVKVEIQKCDVRCANCHRRKTALQRGWTNKIQ